MRFMLTLILLPHLLIAEPFHAQQQIESLSSSVVKIFTSSAKPDQTRPWQMNGQHYSSGSGAIIDNNFILTSAHVVDSGVYIEVRKESSPKKYISHVKWISHEADLALLEVEDKTFFENTKVLKFDGLPYRQSGIVVYGYPEGGNEISITQGIVSRIEQTVYVHSGESLLTIQIDAAINPGNSGGPAFDKEGNIVGIAMQGLTSSENIGYLVSTPVIKHFLNDISDGKYDGFPEVGISTQNMENKTLKKHHNMGNRTGVIVRHVNIDGSSNGYLKKGDVILAIDGVQILDNFTIPMKKNGRVSANYLIARHQVGETSEVTILRNNKEIKIAIPLKINADLIPYEHEKSPEYYIFAGLVFRPLTLNYLQEWGESWTEDAPVHLSNFYLNHNYHTEEKKVLVLFQGALADRANAGYKDTSQIVTKVNGVSINTFKDLVDVIKNSALDNDIIISLSNGNNMILDKNEAIKANKRVLERYGIKSKSHIRGEKPI